MPCDCLFGGSGWNKKEVGLTEGGVMVVWPVCWVVTAGAAEIGGRGGCVACKAGGGGSILGL